MTEEELFAEIKNAYLCLIHLGEGISDAVATILACDNRVSDDLIADLLVGQSWRERLLGLVMACHRGIETFYDIILQGFLDIRGISTIPTAAVLSIAINDFGCNYITEMTSSIDRNTLDGEMGVALDHLHFAIGIVEEPPTQSTGPNYGQGFLEHREFYSKLCFPD